MTGESGDEILLEALDVFNGDLTCCRLKHPHGDPCDREELMLPMLGLFAELYRGRDSTTRDHQRVACEPQAGQLPDADVAVVPGGVEGGLHRPAYFLIWYTLASGLRH